MSTPVPQVVNTQAPPEVPPPPPNQVDLQQYIAQQVTQQVAAIMSQQLPVIQPVAVPIPPQPVPLSSRVRLTQPEVFDGINTSKFNADTWLAAWELLFRAESVTSDREKIMIVATRLSGMATLWFTKTILNKPVLENNWEEFKRVFLQRYQPIDASRTARSILRNLRQHNNTIDYYTNTFSRLLMQVGEMSEEDKIESYIDGLTNIDLKRQVGYEAPHIKTLDEAILKAKQIAVTNMKYSYRRYANNYQPHNYSSNLYGQSQSNSNAASHQGATPMELGMLNSDNLDGYMAEFTSDPQQLNAIQQGSTRQPQSQRRIPDDKYQYCQQNRLCFWCEQPNHTSSVIVCYYY